jgi:hypothetical protein
MQRLAVVIALIFSVVLNVVAEDRAEHGDWTSQFLEGMGEASTHENGLSMFGILCGDDSCRYYFANGLDCEPSVNYPLMLTTDVGAVPVEAVCEPMMTDNGEVLLYWFAETPYLNEAFTKTPTVGIAFPLTNGEFKISRFSMNGFTDAVERMVNVMRDLKPEESIREEDLKREPEPDRT